MYAVLRGHAEASTARSTARKPDAGRLVHPSPESEDKRRREKWLLRRLFHRASQEAKKERSRETQVLIRDARKMQAESGLPPADFFERFGFVLLRHATKVEETDWPAQTRNWATRAVPQRVTSMYVDELEQVVAERLQLRRAGAQATPMMPMRVVRRGPGKEAWADIVHTDFGPSDDYDAPAGLPPWMVPKQWEALAVIKVWRPIKPMAGPVRRTPLALLDPATVIADDLVPVTIEGHNDASRHQYRLRHAAERHVWYHYPEVSSDEVVVLRQFECTNGCGVRAQAEQRAQEQRGVFHAAFANENAPADAEEVHTLEVCLPCWYGIDFTDVLRMIIEGSAPRRRFTQHNRDTRERLVASTNRSHHRNRAFRGLLPHARGRMDGGSVEC